MSACLRCGLCCFLKIKQDDDSIILKPCKHMIRLPSGRTLCRIYKSRLGTDIGYGHQCILRENDKYDYPGCPFNSGKPLLSIKKNKE